MGSGETLATILVTLIGAIASAIARGIYQARRAEREMLKVPPSLPPPRERRDTPTHELEGLRVELRRERWRSEEHERRALDAERELARASAALSAERDQRAADAALLRRWRVYAYELEDRLRALESTHSQSTSPRIELPERIVEHDARPEIPTRPFKSKP